MNSIRTSSLFHYTDYASLSKIIQEGLIPNYCAEDITYKDEKGIAQGTIIGIPMVSFCDIPISRIEEFSDRYGYYAIGINKKWADYNTINPVFYAKDRGALRGFNTMTLIGKFLEDRSHAKDGVLNLNEDFGNADDITFLVNSNIMHDNTMPLFGYVKRYESARIIKSSTGEKTISQNNYLENEWRYIVPESADVKWLWNKEEYESWRGDKSKPKPKPTFSLVNKKLSFDIDDISFIIVKTESQVNNMITLLSNIKKVGGNLICPVDITDSHLRKKCLEIAHRKLVSKIISLERIMKNF